VLQQPVLGLPETRPPYEALTALWISSRLVMVGGEQQGSMVVVVVGDIVVDIRFKSYSWKVEKV
jgi:hypothetical protein